MAGLVARVRLPASHDCIDVQRVEFQPVAAPAYALGRDHGRATTKESVKHDLATRAAVQNGVGDQSDRLDRGMDPEQVTFVTGGAGARIGPNVSAIAPVLA